MEDLRLECLKLAKEILSTGLFIVGTTSKQGQSRKRFEEFLSKSNGDGFVLLDRSSQDEVEAIKTNPSPEIIDIIYFGNKLYQFCIEDKEGIQKIIDEIKNIKDKRIEEENKILEKENKRFEEERIKNEEKEKLEAKDKEDYILNLEKRILEVTGSNIKLSRVFDIETLDKITLNILIYNKKTKE